VILTKDIACCVDINSINSAINMVHS